MSFGPAITATIGADVGPLNAAAPKIEAAGGKIATQLEKRFAGTGQIATALGTALGLNLQNMSEHVAAFVFGVTAEAKKAYEDLANSAERSTEFLKQQLSARRGESQAVVAAERELVSLQKEAAGLSQQQANWVARLAKIQAGFFADTYIGTRLQTAATNEMAAVQAKLGENKLAQQQAGAVLDAARLKMDAEGLRLDQSRFAKSIESLPLREQILELATREYKLQESITNFKGKGVDLDILKKQLAETTVALETAHQKRREEGDKRALELDEERFAYAKAHHEMLELEAKFLSGRIVPEEKARLDVLRLQGKQKEIYRDIEYYLAKPAAERTQQEKGALEVLLRQAEQLNSQINLKEALIRTIQNQVKAEHAVTAEIQNQIAAKNAQEERDQLGSAGRTNSRYLLDGQWFNGAARDRSQFDSASPAALAEFLRRNELKISQVRQGYGTGATALTDVVTGGLIRAMAESVLSTESQYARDRLNQINGLSGVDRGAALRNFQGDPLVFDRLYEAAQSTRTDSGRIVSELQELNESLRNGHARVGTISLDNRRPT